MATDQEKPFAFERPAGEIRVWGTSREDAARKLDALELWEHQHNQFVRAHFEEKATAGDFIGALSILSSEDVAGGIVKLWKKYDLTDEALRDVLREEWSRCDAHRDHRQDLVQCFRAAGYLTDDPEDWLETTEPEVEVMIYRANFGENEPQGISWTLRTATAIWFAEHYLQSYRVKLFGMQPSDGVPTVWSAKVRRRDILAHIIDRDEDEVVVDPDGIYDAERMGECRPKE